MRTTKPFWQELALQSVAPALALLGVTITVRPDILGESTQCKRVTTASLDDGNGNDRAPSKSAPPEPIDSIEVTEVIESYEFSLPHVAIVVACLILLVQVIRLIHNWNK